MTEHRQLFSERAGSLPAPTTSPKRHASSIKSASDFPSVSVRVTSASSAATSPPYIDDRAWLFHTALLPPIRKSAFGRDGSGQQHPSSATQEKPARLLVRDDVAPVEPPKLEPRAGSSVGAEPPPALCMEPNRLFFSDAPSPSGVGESLADRYSLRTLYTSRCSSLGMRCSLDCLLRQLPSEAGQGAADELRMLVLRDTYVPAKACQALTVLLPYCTGLEYIDLSNAGLRSKSGFMTGVNALLDALIFGAEDHGVGAALHTIDVSFNKLSDRTGWRLVRLVQRQPHLRVVNTDGTEISDRVKTRIDEELHRSLKACVPPMLLGEADE
ncbi:hypothetical protein, conserved [Leishmania lindenbergi]|uniref:Uncharacterized protein n=1 Tax=Leishmania lindenbergi TaxID=651832 RepID=A0AAW3A7A9_9TRYP